MVSVYDFKTYKPKSTDKFLFDTNILVFLYNSLNPDLNETKSEVYSNFMAEIGNTDDDHIAHFYTRIMMAYATKPSKEFERGYKALPLCED